MIAVFMLWVVVRFLLALAGLVLVILAVTTALGIFTVSAGGEQLAWYWLLATAFGIGIVGMLIDGLVAWLEDR